jgi:hypothetical protein
MMVEDDFDYTVEQIAKAAEAIRDVPGGVDADILIDELYLGAVAASLESKYVAEAAQWANDYQVRILLYRAMGRSLQDTLMLTFRRMLRRRWLMRFFHGAHPDQLDPRNANISLIGPLEELATNANMEVQFVVQAYLETPIGQRHELLTGLAESSRRERLKDRREGW